MNVLFDTNVVLDVLLDREPFSESASLLMSVVEQGDIKGYICATTLTTIHYLAAKALGKNQAKTQIKKLMTLFDITPVNRTVIEDALQSKFTDFEDSVVYHSSCRAGIEAIVTRDHKGFKNSKLPVYSPAEMIKMLEAID